MEIPTPPRATPSETRVSEDDAAEYIASERVSADQELGGATIGPERWGVGSTQSLLERIMGCDHRREGGEDEQHDEHERTEHAALGPPKHP